ncbi:MAG: hypothetical protein HKN03_06750 [Acidimicrobiales bacterium]|nr:hypothetical protein [Acidimicrobiales bacterium]
MTRPAAHPVAISGIAPAVTLVGALLAGVILVVLVVLAVGWRQRGADQVDSAPGREMILTVRSMEV